MPSWLLDGWRRLRNGGLRTRIERCVTRSSRPARTPTCREAVASLADYVAGELGGDERRGLEGHLADCAECLAYLRSYRATVRSSRDLCGDEDERRAGMPDELLRAIVAALGQSSRNG